MKEVKKDPKEQYYDEFQQSSYWVLECFECGNGFLTETEVHEEKILGEQAWREPDRDGCFTVFCPRCGKKVTGLASEKVNIAIFTQPEDNQTEI